MSKKKKTVRKKAAKKQTKDKVPAVARRLTHKQQRFVDCYDGDIRGTAKRAKISYQYGRLLSTKFNILQAIRNRLNTEVRPKAISTRQARQEFWSEIMNNNCLLTRDRLKASELLGKSECDFPNKHEVTGPKGKPIPVTIVDFKSIKIHDPK